MLLGSLARRAKATKITIMATPTMTIITIAMPGMGAVPSSVLGNAIVRVLMFGCVGLLVGSVELYDSSD